MHLPHNTLAARELWLALHFPSLPLERQRLSDDDAGQAVVIQEGPSRCILSCNDIAREAGIRPGLALNTAWSLLPDLVVTEFNENAQAAHLEQLTLLALTWSSRVTPKAPTSILLEVGASLRLFGGLEALISAIEHALDLQAVSVISGVAPTPAAALLFAQTGVATQVCDARQLDTALAPVPLTPAMLGSTACEGLHRSGVRTLGALRRLPPKPLARRFGSELTDWLYRLDGRLPDPQTPWQAPDTFEQGLDLPLETPDTAALLFPLKRLVAALGGFLTRRDLGLRRLELHLHHHRKPATRLALRFIDATADMAHVFKVAREHLDGASLQAPVVRLALDATELAPVERAGSDLLDRGRAREGGIEQVLDRLRARLGQDALYTAHAGDDHRPEKAWQASLFETPSQLQAWPARPVWLYREPVPVNRKTLTFVTPAERIENGWWDAADVRRDYYIARDAYGSHYWVFHVRRNPEQVWVHGLFG